MLFETFSSFFGDGILGIGFPSDELFDGLDISESLQGFQVAGQIPVGQFHQLLHGVEVADSFTERIDMIPNRIRLSKALFNLDSMFFILFQIIFDVHSCAVNDMANSESDSPKQEAPVGEQGGNNT